MFKSEKEKYLSLYDGVLKDFYIKIDGRGREDGGYGRANWGENAIEFLKTSNCQFVLDYGCGYGRFASQAADSGMTVYATDIASVETGQIVKDERVTFFPTDGFSINLPNKSIDWITSFDCLEHVPEIDLIKVLDEFKRVCSKGFIVSVAYHGDFIGNVPLHMTVKDKNWWIGLFSKYGQVEEWGATPMTKIPYIICYV